MRRLSSVVIQIQWQRSRIAPTTPARIRTDRIHRQRAVATVSAMSAIGPSRYFAASVNLVASLIGRFGSSAFRLSTSAVSMSLAGSCFSSDSAPGPFHYGIRGRGGTIYWTALPSDGRQVQATKRTHLIHRPARDIIPPRGGARVFSYRM